MKTYSLPLRVKAACVFSVLVSSLFSVKCKKKHYGFLVNNIVLNKKKTIKLKQIKEYANP